MAAKAETVDDIGHAIGGIRTVGVAATVVNIWGKARGVLDAGLAAVHAYNTFSNRNSTTAQKVGATLNLVFKTFNDFCEDFFRYWAGMSLLDLAGLAVDSSKGGTHRIPYFSALSATGFRIFLHIFEILTIAKDYR